MLINICSNNSRGKIVILWNKLIKFKRRNISNLLCALNAYRALDLNGLSLSLQKEQKRRICDDKEPNEAADRAQT